MFQAYSVPEIKRILGEIYSDVNLGKAPTTTDLERWYKTKRTKKDGQDVIIMEGERIIIM